MTTDHAVRFFMQTPFEPLILCLTDGREIHVPHRDFAMLGEGAVVVVVYHRSLQIEVIDTAFIVSIRTLGASDPDAWRF